MTANENLSHDTDRIIREKKFHNEAFSDKRRESVNRFYSACSAYYRDFENELHQFANGRKVLEYGCGTGTHAFDLASWGSHVTGIDISEEAIRQSIEQAKQSGISDRTEFYCMNAEAMTFPDATFDLICGSAILHHLNLPEALREINRVLKPGGIAIFGEPLGHNPIINLFRKLTPKLRTSDEHPLLITDIKLMSDFFYRVDVKWYSLTTPYIAVLPASLMKRILPAFESVDRAIFHIKSIQKYAWLCLIRLQKKE